MFDEYQDMIDSETGAALFNAKARKNAASVLELILTGVASDPPNTSFYMPKKNQRGAEIIDADGLPLLRCFRG